MKYVNCALGFGIGVLLYAAIKYSLGYDRLEGFVWFGAALILGAGALHMLQYLAKAE